MFSLSRVGGLMGGAQGAVGELGGINFSDPLWDSVVLLSNLDVMPPTDLSIGGHTLSDGGAGATLDSSIFRFGAGSSDLDATSTAYVSAVDHADWNLGAGDFTVECWVRFDADPGATDDSYFVSQWDTTGNERSWALYLQNDTIEFGHSIDGTAEVFVSIAWTPTDSQWYHVAAFRSSGLLRIAVDGKILTIAADAATYNDSAAQLRIGTPVNTGDGNFQRNIDEVRITKGADRYG